MRVKSVVLQEGIHMEKKISIFGASDCYGLSKDLSFTIRLACEMDEKVDEACLREAAVMLEKRFYYLKVSLRKGVRSFYYVENPRPWVVVRSDRPIALNSEESNGQLLAFSYDENTIYVNVYHGQMDGTGLYRVTKALIYYYCCRRYNRAFDVPDVALPDDKIEPEEYRDVYRDLYESSKKEKFPDALKPQEKVSRPMKLQEMGLVHPGRNRRAFLRLAVPQADMMKYCSSYDGSPVTAIALMMAEVVYKMHSDSDREIVIGIPVNLRPVLGMKNSLANTYAKVYVPYSEKVRSMDFEAQGTICRGIVIRNTDPDLLRAEAVKYCSKLAMLKLIPLTCLKQFGAQTIAAGMKKAETADVTYIGKFEFGEMEEHIRSIFIDVDGYGIGLMVILTAYADKFFFTIDQDWKEKDYLKAFLKVLKEKGISYKIDSFGKLVTPEMKGI